MTTTADHSTRKERRAQARAHRLEVEQAEHDAAARRGRAMRLGILAGVVALAVAALVVIGSGSDDPVATSPGPGGGDALFAGIQQEGAVLGDPEAPVTIVEYADLQCPACKMFSDTVLPELVDDYVRTGRAKLVFRNFPFLGPDSSRAAAVAGAAAEQDRLWPFVHAFYSNQGPENTGYVTEGFLREIGAAAGIDVDRALADRRSDAVRRRLGEDATWAGRHGVDSTPTIYIGTTPENVKQVEWTGDGASAFTAAIDELLK